jgi:hypothetical protein
MSIFVRLFPNAAFDAFRPLVCHSLAPCYHAFERRIALSWRSGPPGSVQPLWGYPRGS